MSLQISSVGKCPSAVNIDAIVLLFNTGTCKLVSVEEFEAFADLKWSNDAKNTVNSERSVMC